MRSSHGLTSGPVYGLFVHLPFFRYARAAGALLFMTSSSLPSPEESGDTAGLSEAFLACIQAEAEKIQAEFDSVTPMIAQARSLLWLDTLARLHEAGLDEAIKAGDATQASAWTRDLALFEVVISLVRNIQPMDMNAEGDDPGADGGGDVSVAIG